MVESFGILIGVSFIISLLFQNVSVFVSGVLCCCLVLYMVRILYGTHNVKMYRIVSCLWTVGLAVAVILYYVYISLYNVPYDMVGTDDYYYDNIWSVYCLEKGYFWPWELLYDNDVFYVLHNSKGMVILLVWLRELADFFGGYHTMNFRILNVSLWVMCGLLMGKYAVKYEGFTEQQVHKLLGILVLLPNALYISSHVYRDTIVAFFIVTSFYIWTGFSKKNIVEKCGIILVTLVLFVATYWLRTQAVIYLAIAIAVSVFNACAEKSFISKRISVKQVLIIGVFVIGLLVIGNKIYDEIIRYFSSYVNMAVESGSSLKSFVFSLPILPFGWIVRCVFYLISPLYPQIVTFWKYDDLLDIIYAIVTWGTVFLLFLYPYVIRYVKRFNNITIMFLTIFFSVVLTTSGYRHIMMIYPFMITMGVTEYFRSNAKKRNQNLLLSLMCFLIGVPAYIMLKLF